MSSRPERGAPDEHELFTILARGPWEPARLLSRRVPREVRRDPSAARILDAAWESAVARARLCGQTLYPGRVHGLAAWRVTEGGLELDFHETDYREFVGTNLSPEYRALPREQATRSDALGLSVLLVSGDQVVLHRRGAGCYEWPLAIDTPGGHMEPGQHDDARGDPSPLRAGLDEPSSELGLSEGDVSGLQALALTRIHDTEKPQLVLAARTRLSPDEIRVRVGAARESFETDELVPVPLSALDRLDRERLTPAGRAAVRLARDGLRFLPL